MHSHSLQEPERPEAPHWLHFQCATPVLEKLKLGSRMQWHLYTRIITTTIYCLWEKYLQTIIASGVQRSWKPDPHLARVLPAEVTPILPVDPVTKICLDLCTCEWCNLISHPDVPPVGRQLWQRGKFTSSAVLLMLSTLCTWFLTKVIWNRSLTPISFAFLYLPI